MEGVQIGNLQIPIAKGDKGDTGAAGKISSLSITMLDSTATPTVTNSGTVYDAQYTLGIPRGTGVSNCSVNDSGELVISLTSGSSINVGTVVGTSITNVEIDDEYNLVVTLSDETEIDAGNLEDEISDIIEGYLADYYDKDTADGKFALITETGNKIDLSVNSSTYVVTATLKDKNNNTLSTATIDLPLESVVVSGSYDSTNKKIILTLQSGSTIEFSVADLVSGLQSEITSSNKLSADLVDDTSTTNKFVNSTEKTKIANSITASDYATSNTGGTIKLGNGFGKNGTTGVAEASVWSTSHTFGEREFIGYKTLMNILDDVVGDIDSALDAINR